MAKGDPRTGGGSGYFPGIYQSAVSQAGEDYDSIMGQYKQLGDTARSNASNSYGEKVNYSPISPQFTEYSPGSNYDYLREFVDTGGYSGDDVANLRARAISPIRSIYDSANRNLLRQKNLSGGYSPNMNAAQAKMARESSNLIAGKTTDANAAIAEMVQRGKLSGATALAPLEARETELRNSINVGNTNAANTAAQFNANRELDVARHNTSVETNDFDNILKTIQGQQGMFSASPGMLDTIGSQTMQAANTVNNFAPVPKGSMATAPKVSINPVTGRPYGDQSAPTYRFGY